MDYKPYGTANTVLIGLQLDISNTIIIQWGQTGVVSTYNFPITFPNNFFSVTGQPITATTKTDYTSYSWVSQAVGFITGVSLSSFTKHDKGHSLYIIAIGN